MQILCLVFVALTLILSGGYAGMVLMCQIGVLPAMRLLAPRAYADAWRAMDSYMERSMPPYKGALLLSNAAALVLLIMQHRIQLASAAAVSLLCSVAGLVLTVRGQLPLNATLKSLPPSADEALLIGIRERTVSGFSTRFAFAAVAFLAIGIGVVIWPLR